MTPKQQIDRLNRPGCTYFNLNPYDLSLLVHPDKNRDDSERAQKAFDGWYMEYFVFLLAVAKAYRTLEDPEASRKCLEVVEEAKERVEQMKRHAVYVQTCKLFADLERLRVEEELKQSNDRKRKAEEEEEERKAAELEKEWRKNYEDSRNERVASWRDFKAKKSRSSRGLGGFKPPKPKMEQRPG
ncbi:unnamed protein product [Echinostoma caproni]|uniref:J domain-containing protein n=1 Tax=Echinostoma caproni TaxID=27848 RepID=A0A3P8L8C2_9TREM|nr:unnamed protein product [Echinostoma caproni]